MWVLFALLNPVSEALRSLIARRVSKKVDPLIISWANNFIPFLVFTPLLFFIELKFNQGFYIGVCGSAAINIVATIYYMRAISEGEISAVMPMLAFTPMFLLITSPIMVGEFPNALGFTGIILVVAGSYLLNLNRKSKNIFEPLLTLIREKGTRYMLFVAFLWSFSANFDKISINNSSMLQHIVFVNLIIFVTLTVIIGIKKKLTISQLKSGRKELLIISSFTTASFIFHMTALSLTLVAYVVALKRLSGIISVLLGYFFLKEGNLKGRLAGAAVMFTGVILIVIS